MRQEKGPQSTRGSRDWSVLSGKVWRVDVHVARSHERTASLQ